MKVRAAILEDMGRAPPYAQSRPLTIGEIDLQGPASGEVLVKIRAAGLCHSDLSTINGDRPRQMPMVLGHEAAGEVRRSDRRSRSRRRRPRHPGLRAELRPLPAVHGGTPGAVRAGLHGQRRRHSAVGRDAAQQRRRAKSAPVGVSAFAEYARARANRWSRSTARAVGGGRTVRLRGDDRRRRRHQHGKGRAGASVAVVGFGGVGLMSMLGARLGGRAADRRHRHARRQAGGRHVARRNGQFQGGRRRGAGDQGRNGAAFISPSKWPERSPRSTSPTGSPGAAA